MTDEQEYHIEQLGLQLGLTQMHLASHVYMRWGCDLADLDARDADTLIDILIGWTRLELAS